MMAIVIESSNIKSSMKNAALETSELTSGTNRSKRFPNWQMHAVNRAISFGDQISEIGMKSQTEQKARKKYTTAARELTEGVVSSKRIR